MRGSQRVTVVVAFVLLGALSLPCGAAIVYVDVMGGGDFTTIQEGLNAASDGDTVLVAAGTYTGDLNRNLDPGLKNAVIMSVGGPQATVVDCEQTGRGFHIHGGQDNHTVIEGFTVTGGSVSGRGGGISCEAGSSPQIKDCEIVGNTALGEWPDGVGGGLYLGEGCDANVSDCTFSQNEAVFGGGALMLSASAVVVRTGFVDNTASSGGGGAACVSASPSFVECELVGNVAAFGGGVACDGGGPSFADCRFSLNEVQYHGGGMTAHWSAPELERCIFEENTAGALGGAVICECPGLDTGARGNPAPVLIGCALIRNAAGDGGGVYARMEAAPELTGCTLYANSGSDGAGISCWQVAASVTDCIIADSIEGAAVYCHDPGAVPYLRRCVIFGNEGGDTPCGDFADILYMDPLFCDASGGNLGLCADSPCLPGGNPWAVQIGAYGEACGPCATAVQPTTWGRVKSMFRQTGE